MKTNMITTITLAVVMTISVNAQNTKSFKENSLANKLSKIVKENISGITNELTNLKAVVQYKPEAIYDYSCLTAETSVVDLSELESVVKYNPANIIETETVKTSNDFSLVLEELKESVKYKPETVTSDNGNLLSYITNELASAARYYPAS